MKNNIVIAGGTGFIGQYLQQKFEDLGYNVLIISRKKQHISWDDKAGIAAALEDATLVINLAGKSVDCRYTEKNKKEILDSRLDTTKKLGAAILTCKNPPPLWINSSTATIYRHAEDRPMTETKGEIGKGFSVNVATSWENAFFAFNLPSTRQVALRMAIVLGSSGGVIKPLHTMVKAGLGGKQGKGTQMFSWVHVDDVYNIIHFLTLHTELKGVFNTAAPGPVNNKILMQSIRKQLHIPIGFPAPGWLLKVGAVMIRTETELILKSRWVIPERLTAAGFTFKYPSLSDALQNIFST